MDDGYVFVINVYNYIEAENVAGILEMEGIEANQIIEVEMVRGDF